MSDHPTIQVCIGDAPKPPFLTAEVPEKGVLELPQDDRTAAVDTGTSIHLVRAKETRKVLETVDSPEGKLRVRLGPVVD